VQYEIEVNGRVRQIAVHRVDGRFLVTVDGREWKVDAARIDPHTWSLLLESPGGSSGLSASFEVTLAPDAGSGGMIARVDETPVTVVVNGRRQWGRKKDDGTQSGSTGPERVLAPMPGKIVRVLVKTGESVRARQPVVVIEAMKMENELRASADGTVAEMHVRDGQSVDAGALLAVIHR